MNRIKNLLGELGSMTPSKGVEDVLVNMISECDRLGFYPAKHIARVANRKALNEDWTMCPCDSNNPERFCISDLCQKSIIEDGHCHCGCFTKENPETAA